MTHAKLIFAMVVLFMAGCGDVPPDLTASPVTAPMCDPDSVGGNLKCGPQDQPVAFVTCATYAYNQRTGEYQGSQPVTGCTLDFLARPGMPYTATCIESCDDVGL